MKMMIPTLIDCQRVRIWRNSWLISLRTPYELTEEMQEEFYENIIAKRDSVHKYWSIYDGDKFVAFGGITNIQHENKLGEISLIVNPEFVKQGYGSKSVDLLLDKAFNYLNIKTVFGECYMCNPVIGFWEKIIEKYKGYKTELPNRKFWNGLYYASMYFSIDATSFPQHEYESKQEWVYGA